MKTVLRIALLILIFCSALTAQPKQLNWYSSYQKALADSKKTNRPIFIDIYADWCGWCHKLDRDVYSTSQFITYMQGYVPVKLNAEDNGEGTEFAKRFQVDGFPTLIVTDSEGNVTNRIGGYMEANALIADMTAVQTLVQKEKKNPGDVQPAFLLARQYLTRDMYAEAKSRYEKVVASPKATTDEKDEAQFSLALAQYYLRDLQSALTSLGTYRTQYPSGKSGEDALLLLSQIHVETDAKDKAKADLQEFLQKYPNSENVPRAKQVLDILNQKTTEN